MNKIKLLLFLMLMGIGIGVQAQAPELTVYDGTNTSENLPFCGYDADYYFRAQHIIPATDLVSLQGKTIYGLRYYSTSTADKSWGNSKVEVYLKEVDYSAFATNAYEAHAAIDVVYTGKVECVLNSGTKAEMMIIFKYPFTYTGDNLLIGFDNITKGSLSRCQFYGTTVASNSGVYGYNLSSLDAISNISAKTFIPKTTFLLDGDAINQAAAQRVIDLIDAIGTVTLKSEKAIKTARDAYDGMNATQQALVSNLSTLVNAEAELADLQALEIKLTISNLAASDITANSANISWTGAGDSYDFRHAITPAVQYSMGFEDSENFSAWTIIDADGDGNNWSKSTKVGHTGGTSIVSYSYSSGALDPDNWLISPLVELGGTLTFWTNGLYKDHFGVAVSTTSNTDVSTFTMLEDEYNSTDGWKQFTYDLSAYSGQQGYVAIRHYNSYNCYYLYIDDIEISEPFAWTEVKGLNATSRALSGLDALTNYTVQVRSHAGTHIGKWNMLTFKTEPSAAVQAEIDAVIALIDLISDPVTLASESDIEKARTAYDKLSAEQQALVTNYSVLTDAEKTLADLKANALTVSNLAAADVTGNSANITWTGSGESYDLWYKKRGEVYDFDSDIVPWSTIDADGDGYTWEFGSYGSLDTHNGSTGCVCSASFENGVGALTPDNWLVSPQVTLEGTLSFWATGQDHTSVAEHFQVYVSTTGSNVGDFIAISPEYINTTSRDYQYYSFDLSSYNGQKGYVAIRHFNCSDEFKLLIDDIQILAPGITWTKFDGLTATQKALSGLQDGTSYDVQVRSHYGSEIGEWATFTFSTVMSAAAQAEIDAVIALIDAISDPVTLASESDIVKARTAYDKLSSGQRVLVTNYSVLTAAEATLATLIAEQLEISNFAVKDITTTSANISWTGIGESYDLWYALSPTVIYHMGFEDNEDFSGWTMIDADGDGNNWGASTNTDYVHTGSVSMVSKSKSAVALTPDNYLISPKLELGSRLTFWVAGNGTAPDYFGVYVSTTSNSDPSAFTELHQGNTSFGWKQMTLDLSAYSGQQGYIIFRHFKSSGMDFISFDDIELSVPNAWTKINDLTATEYALTGLTESTFYDIQVRSHYGTHESKWTSLAFHTLAGETDKAAAQAVIDLINAIGTVTLASETAIVNARTAYDGLTTIQAELVTNYNVLQEAEATFATLLANILKIDDIAAKDITTTSATISWAGTGDSYDLRYAASASISMGFEDSEDFSDWTIIDADGDGANWEKSTTANHTGTSGISSKSDGLAPDNWLVSPLVDLGGTLTFWAKSYSDSYKDHFGVAVSTTSNTDPSAFTMLSSEYTPTSTWTQYTYDLSAFSGQGYVAIRHYNSTDKYYLFIDDVEITYLSTSWNDFNNLTTTQQALSGLTADTKYTVQIRSHYGAREGEWTTYTFNTATNDEDAAAANAVIDKIQAIGTVTLSSETDIVDARTSYEALTDAQKALVGVYLATLEEAEYRLAYLKDAEGWQGWFYYDDQNFDLSYGNSGSSFEWGILVPANTIAKNTLTKVALYEKDGSATEDITLTIYNGGDLPDAANSIYTETFTPEHANEYHIVTLATPVDIDPTQNIWIIFASKKSYPMSITKSAYVPGVCWRNYSPWREFPDAIGYECAFKIRAFFETVIDGDTQDVIDLINDIDPNITLESEMDINSARSAYNNLNPAQQALVSNYDLLVDYEAELAALKAAAEAQALADAKAELLNYVNELGTLKAYVENELKDATYTGILTDAYNAAIGVYESTTATIQDVNDAIAAAKSTLNSSMTAILILAKSGMKDALDAELDKYGLTGTDPYQTIINEAKVQVNAVTIDLNKPVADIIDAVTLALGTIYNNALTELDYALAEAAKDELLWNMNELWTLSNYLEGKDRTTEAQQLKDAYDAALAIYAQSPVTLQEVNDAIDAASTLRSNTIGAILLVVKDEMFANLENELYADEKGKEPFLTILNTAKAQVVTALNVDMSKEASIIIDDVETAWYSIYGAFTSALGPAREVADVIAIIDAIPTPISVDCESAIVDARFRFEALTEEQQALVTNIGKLDQYEIDLQNAKDERNALYLALSAARDDLDALYNASLTYSPDRKDALEAAYTAAYDAYNDVTITNEGLADAVDAAQDAIAEHYLPVIQDLKDAFKQQLDDLKEEGMYPEVNAIISEAKDKIDLLTIDDTENAYVNIYDITNACQNIVDEASDDIYSLRISDYRSIVNWCEYTGFKGVLEAGKVWNANLRDATANAFVKIDPTAPYYIKSEYITVCVWDEVSGEAVDVLDTDESPVLEANKTYRLGIYLFIDGDAAKDYRFSMTFEGAPVVKVDDEPWELAYSSVTLADSYIVAASPVFVLKESATDIEQNAENMKVQKVLRNGQIYILRGDKTFTIMGARAE